MDQARAGVAQAGEEERKMGEGGRTKRSSSKRMRVRVMCAFPRESCFSGPVSLHQEKVFERSTNACVKVTFDQACPWELPQYECQATASQALSQISSYTQGRHHTTFRHVPTAIHAA